MEALKELKRSFENFARKAPPPLNEIAEAVLSSSSEKIDNILDELKKPDADLEKIRGSLVELLKNTKNAFFELAKKKFSEKYGKIQAELAFRFGPIPKISKQLDRLIDGLASGNAAEVLGSLDEIVVQFKKLVDIVSEMWKLPKLPDASDLPDVP